MFLYHYRFDQADAGRVWLDHHELTHAAMHERASLGLGYLPQEASVFRTLTTEANIMAMLELNSALDGQAAAPFGSVAPKSLDLSTCEDLGQV